MQYRHGDLLIVKVGSLPKDAALVETKVLADGEATGHAHRLEKDGVLYIKDGQLFLEAVVDVAVVHEEHARITLSPGIYEVRRQREYQPGALPRQVAD